MAMPAKKYDFNDIVSCVPLMSAEERETLEIILNESLYKDINTRRNQYKTENMEGKTFSIEEVLGELEED